jgi:hypothetical protein
MERILIALLWAVAAAIPIVPPADWAPLIARGDMAYTLDEPAAIGIGLYPVVGNGFLAIETGPFTQPFINTWCGDKIIHVRMCLWPIILACYPSQAVARRRGL